LIQFVDATAETPATVPTPAQLWPVDIFQSVWLLPWSTNATGRLATGRR
jgi:hypothetical protein